MLAAEGNPYVDMPEVKQGEETRYVWKSHGNNVKSIAKGVCEFAGLTHDDQPAIIDVREAESFTAIKKSVEQARRFGEDADKRILREAKDALREACANLISEAIKSDDAELIAELALEVEVRTDEWKADVRMRWNSKRMPTRKRKRKRKRKRPSRTNVTRALRGAGCAVPVNSLDTVARICHNTYSGQSALIRGCCDHSTKVQRCIFICV
jgi:hypothetical protein